MKKKFYLIMASILILMLMSACGKSDNKAVVESNSKFIVKLEKTVSTAPTSQTMLTTPTVTTTSTASIAPTEQNSNGSKISSDPQQTPVGTKSESELFIPVIESNKYGLVNQEGTFIVEPIYDYMEPFSEDLALVEIDGKYGYIDNKGNISIEMKFDFAQSFCEGMATVEINGEYGYIDKTGTVVIKPEYQEADSFSDDLARVKLPDELWSYISKDGKTVITTEYGFVGNFHENRAYVQVCNGLTGTYGYIDKSGKMVIEPKTGGYTQDLPPTDFSEGFAIMKIEKDDGKIVKVFVDKDGKILGDHEFIEAYEFSDGLAYADGGFIDKTGNYVLRERDLFDGDCSLGLQFSEGLVDITIEGKTGFIDNKGNIIIEPLYDNIYAGFENGYAVVALDYKKTYIDKSGKIIWQENSIN